MPPTKVKYGFLRATSVVDFVLVLIPLAYGIIGFEVFAGWRSARTLYVSGNGSDWNRGVTPDSSVATLQRALDLAIPGDRIVVRPGTYYERVHVRRGGSLSAPVTITAETPGSVVITGADPQGIPAAWTWRSEGDGIYSTPVHHPVYRLNHGEMTCFRIPWGGVAALRKYITRPSSWSAFCTEQDRLYVFLKDGVPPQGASLNTHRPAPAPREWGEFKSAVVWIESDHVRIEGLRIEEGIGAAVSIWNAEDIEIRDCAFSGSTLGIRCAVGSKSARNLRIVNCLYHNYPQYHWHRDWLTWDEVYSAYASSALVASTAAPLSVENCLVVHGGDALRISPKQTASRAETRIAHNFLSYCTDDAIEFDGDASLMTVEHNLIYEAHQNLGLSPVEQGPVRVRENLFLHSPEGINGSQIKLITNREGERIRNIDIRDNVFVGDWLCWWNTAPMQAIQVENNRFFVRRMVEPPWPPTGVTVAEGQIELTQTPVSPEQKLAEWFHQHTPPEWMRELFATTPGPTWWVAADHPATNDAMSWRQKLQQRLSVNSPLEHN